MFAQDVYEDWAPVTTTPRDGEPKISDSSKLLETSPDSVEDKAPPLDNSVAKSVAIVPRTKSGGKKGLVTVAFNVISTPDRAPTTVLVLPTTHTIVETTPPVAATRRTLTIDNDCEFKGTPTTETKAVLKATCNAAASKGLVRISDGEARPVMFKHKVVYTVEPGAV